MANSATSNRTKGLFITFEGGEGAGKSTQIKLLAKHLEDEGHPVVLTREPGGTVGAELIRDLILSGDVEKSGPEQEAILFTAARLDHIEQKIQPALKTGKIVLCDRFADSTRVYQSATSQMPMSLIDGLENLIRPSAWPDCTILLDIEPNIGIKRVQSRNKDGEAPDRFEKEALAEHKRRRMAFLRIAEADPKRCHVIKANSEPQVVHDAIWKVISSLLKIEKGAVRG
ncbi:MAG: dTMP kinase [Pseudomonadota bacterium]